MATQINTEFLSQLYQSRPRLAFHADYSFETLSKLGEGGMGVVYRVRDLRLHRDAALKMTRSADVDTAVRFLREAKITARLDHPSIPPVFELGETPAGQLYILMRLIRGQTLREKLALWIEDEELAEHRTELLGVVLKVAEAVGYGHSQGIVHRDLKPENIMVGEFGEVLVMDWGIAKDLNQEHEDPLLKSVVTESELQQAGLTVTGGVLGTPGYMSPEQLDGAEIDERADIFALGAVLFEVLTGSKAIRARTTVELLAATMSGQVERASHFDGSIGRDLDWIVARAMAPDLSERTETVKQFIEQLKAVLAGELVPGYRYSLTQRMGRALRRSPGRILAFSVFIVVLAVFLGVWQSVETARQRSRQERAETELRLRDEADKRRLAEQKSSRARGVLELFSKAQSLLRHGAPKPAIKEAVDEALKTDGGHQSAMLEGARILEQAGLEEACRVVLNDIIERCPPAYSALFILHQLDLGEREFEMTKPLERLLHLSRGRKEENEFTLIVEAVEKHEAGSLKEALELYDRAEKYSTRLATLYFNRGRLYGQLKRDEEALDDYDRGLELNPRAYRVFICRGQIFMKQGHLELAEDDFNHAIAIQARSHEALIYRGQIQVRRARLELAENDFSLALELQPESTQILLARAQLRNRRGRSGDALKDLKQLIQLEPSHVEGLLCLARCYISVNELEKAELTLKSLASLDLTQNIRQEMQALQQELVKKKAEGQ